MANFGYKTLGFGTNATAGYELPVVAGLILHLGSDLGITKDGSNKVSSWLDQSPNAYELSQTTGSKQPIWVDSLINGHAVIRFDGIDDELSISNFSQPSTNLHLFWVYNQVSWTSLDTHMIYPGTSPNPVQNTSAPQMRIDSGYADLVNGPTIGDFGLSIAFAPDSNGTGGKYALNDDAYVSKPIRTSSTTGSYYLGSGAGTRYANTEFAEFIAYEGEKIGDDLTNIKTYINNRYGLW